MPAHGDDAACTGAGVRKPSMKETAMGEGWWCGLHYGNLNAAADAPEGRRSDAGLRQVPMPWSSLVGRQQTR